MEKKTAGPFFEDLSADHSAAATILEGDRGTEALRLYVSYLFARLDVPRVGITTWSGNERMMRAAARIGMRIEGRMRRCRIVRGELYDSIRMGVLREEWEALHGPSER